MCQICVLNIDTNIAEINIAKTEIDSAIHASNLMLETLIFSMKKI